MQTPLPEAKVAPALMWTWLGHVEAFIEKADAYLVEVEARLTVLEARIHNVEKNLDGR